MVLLAESEEAAIGAPALRVWAHGRPLQRELRKECLRFAISTYVCMYVYSIMLNAQVKASVIAVYQVY